MKKLCEIYDVSQEYEMKENSILVCVSDFNQDKLYSILPELKMNFNKVFNDDEWQEYLEINNKYNRNEAKHQMREIRQSKRLESDVSHIYEIDIGESLENMNDGIGTMKIANKLIEMHKLNASGVVKWNAATINRILNNKTYAGYVVYGKSYSNNYLEQRRVNNYDTSTYMYAKGDFEPIISEEVWNKCQEIKKNRVTSCFGTTVNGKPKNHGKIEAKDVWVKKLKCSCGASFRKNRWHKNKNCDWSYGYQCYNQLNNGSAKQRRLAGENDEGYCDQRMIADWKLELMAKMVFEEVWKNRTDCISETIKIIKRCYRENKVENNPKNSIMFQIEKIKSKKNILLDMRTSGEITKDEFLEQKEVLNKKLSLLESELQNCIEIDTKQIQIDYDEILKSLNEIVNFSNSKMDRELLQRFIAKVVPNGENHFIWYLNLDGKSDTQLNVDIVGNKKNALVSIDESGDTSPLHISDILYFNDKKSFTVETLHRLQLLKRLQNNH